MLLSSITEAMSYTLLSAFRNQVTGNPLLVLGWRSSKVQVDSFLAPNCGMSLVALWVESMQMRSLLWGHIFLSATGKRNQPQLLVQVCFELAT